MKALTPKVTIPRPYKLEKAELYAVDPLVVEEFNLAKTAVILRTIWATPKGGKWAHLALNDAKMLDELGELIWASHLRQVRRACGEDV